MSFHGLRRPGTGPASLVLSLLLLAACEKTEPHQGTSDSGIRIWEGGPEPDAGRRSDAGRDVDPDSGTMNHDAGSMDDAGEPHDAGAVRRDASGDPLDVLRIEFCVAEARAICNAARACACGESIDSSEEVARCTSVKESECARSIEESFGEALRTHVAWVDVPRLQSCMARVSAMYAACEIAAPSRGGECLTAVASATRVGEACIGRYCAFGDGECGFTGVCEALPGVGEPCIIACREGLACHEGTCILPGGEGASCTQSSECDQPFRCVASHCVRAARAGEACASEDACAPGLLCRSGVCTVPAAACVWRDACGARAACIGTTARQVCQAEITVGSPCSPTTTCVPNSYCDPSTGRCTPHHPEGTRCDRPDQCSVGFVCDGSPGHCVPLPGDGARCTADGRCAAGLGCDRSDDVLGRCRTRRGEGAECGTTEICQETLYCDGATLRCVPRSGLGVRCLGDTCRQDLACTFDPSTFTSTCQARPPFGSSCEGSGVCEAGSFCETRAIDGQCGSDLCTTARIAAETPLEPTP